MAIGMEKLPLQVFGDSKFVINELLENNEVKKPELHSYHDYG